MRYNDDSNKIVDTSVVAKRGSKGQVEDCIDVMMQFWWESHCTDERILDEIDRLEERYVELTGDIYVDSMTREMMDDGLRDETGMGMNEWMRVFAEDYAELDKLVKEGKING